MSKEWFNLATDLRRISYWLYYGRLELAKKFLVMAKEKYQLPDTSGRLRWRREIDRVFNLEGGQERASDRAATLASLMMAEGRRRERKS